MFIWDNFSCARFLATLSEAVIKPLRSRFCVQRLQNYFKYSYSPNWEANFGILLIFQLETNGFATTYVLVSRHCNEKFCSENILYFRCK